MEKKLIYRNNFRIDKVGNVTKKLIRNIFFIKEDIHQKSVIKLILLFDNTRNFFLLFNIKLIFYKIFNI